MSKFFRKLHRWLGLAMAVQIIAWMASGLWFSLFPIEEIRGEHLTVPTEPLDLQHLGGLAAPDAVQAALDSHFPGPWTLSDLTLMRQAGQLQWRAAGEQEGRPFQRLVPAAGGPVAPALSAAEAEARARSLLRFPAEPAAVEWIEQLDADHEVRGRHVPLWRVRFDVPESLNLYLDPWTGELVARRTDRWRIFDFFWMLHIMDFDSRDNFNHSLLQVAAGLGLVISVSGVVLWALTSTLIRRRRRQARGRIG
jgi:uncharacterized iron-regulated membrane protein